MVVFPQVGQLHLNTFLIQKEQRIHKLIIYLGNISKQIGKIVSRNKSYKPFNSISWTLIKYKQKRTKLQNYFYIHLLYEGSLESLWPQCKKL